MVTLIIIALIVNITRSKGKLDVHTLGGVMLLKTSQPSRTHMIRRVDCGQQKRQIKDKFNNFDVEN